MTCPRCTRPATFSSATVGDGYSTRRRWVSDCCFASLTDVGGSSADRVSQALARRQRTFPDLVW